MFMMMMLMTMGLIIVNVIVIMSLIYKSFYHLPALLLINFANVHLNVLLYDTKVE